MMFALATVNSPTGTAIADKMWPPTAITLPAIRSVQPHSDKHTPRLGLSRTAKCRMPDGRWHCLSKIAHLKRYRVAACRN